MSSNGRFVSSAFRVTIDKDIAILQSVDASVMHFQAQEFNRIFDLLREQGFRRFVIDLSTCEYISSEGLTCTASCWKWCHDEGNGHMVAIVPQNPDNEVRNLFDIIGLSRMIGSALQPALTQAVKYLREFS
jgi:hypothetical protein